MAEVTTRHATFYEGLIFIDVVEDDAAPLNRNLVRIEATNDSARPFTIEIQRGNGVVWQSRTLAAGESVSVNAGGPVRSVDDLPVWRMGQS